MKEQAGKEGEALLSVEELLQQAKGWSKFDPYANDIERLVAGGVRQRVISEWLNQRGVKVANGEISHWLRRRRDQRNRRQQLASTLSQAEVRPAPAAAAGQDPRSADAAPTVQETVPAVPETGRPMRSADERSSTKNQAELDLDAQVEAAREQARQNRRAALRRGDKASS